MRVRWLARAARDLDQELSFIASDSPAAARTIHDRVMRAVDVLVTQPGMGRPGRVHGTRELVIDRTRYIIPYRVSSDSIEILRVFHTSRRTPSSW